jgi:single-strand DNA-binding protein
MNHVMIMGRLARDPDVRKIESGSTIARFCIACDRGDKNRTTDWIDCCAWNNTAKFVAEYFRKGKPIAVTGAITTRNYDVDGQTRKAVEILVNSAAFVPADSSRNEQEDTSSAEEQLEF